MERMRCYAIWHTSRTSKDHGFLPRPKRGELAEDVVPCLDKPPRLFERKCDAIRARDWWMKGGCGRYLHNTKVVRVGIT